MSVIKTLVVLLVSTLAAIAVPATAAELALGPMPISLKTLPVPPVPGLLDGAAPIVVDRGAAIVLGKALFWDTNAGSDGMACASCHFRAGADGRVKNQLAPGGQSTPVVAQAFVAAADGTAMGPNRTLHAADFPFHLRADPLDPNSPVVREADQIGGSAGTFGGTFSAVGKLSGANDFCARAPDPRYTTAGIGTRRVTPRNAPSVVNAIFNHRAFWDGRANNVFNGSSPWGERDPDAGVWVRTAAGAVVHERLHLVNSALASLATAPPLNDTEMSCRGRTLPELGRKLLWRQALQSQKVDYADSVLGPYGTSEKGLQKNGLTMQYRQLVMTAFAPRYWNAPGTMPVPVPVGKAPYTQMEANFGMFFGLAIQLYLGTLVSDEAPFDRSARDAAFQPVELSAAELRGLKQFRKMLCGLCHLGPAFTSAAVNANAALAPAHPEAFGEPTFRISTTTNVVERIPLLFAAKGPVTAFYDTGFAATGVAREGADKGLGGVDDFGHPLSFSLQYLQLLAGNPNGVLDADVPNVRACDFQKEFAVNYKPRMLAPSLFTPADGVVPQPQTTERCFLPPASNAFVPATAAALAELNNPNTKKMVAALDASFKIPGLRNVELTGPYMHDGSMATLEQVIEFYARGGNYGADAKQITRVFAHPELQLDAQNRGDLVAFLKTLTDERVRYERAPFDHPELRVPHGQTGDHLIVGGGNVLGRTLGRDELMTIEAVGAEGRATPLPPFAEVLAP